MKFRSKTSKFVIGTGQTRFIYWQYIPGDRFVTDMPGFNKVSNVKWNKDKAGNIVWTNNGLHPRILRPSEWIIVDEYKGTFLDSTATGPRSFGAGYYRATVHLFGENMVVMRKF